MSKLPFDRGDEQFSLDMQQVSDIYQQLSTDLFINIVRRLKERGTADLIREPYIWQLEKLNDMHLLTEDNVKLIAKRAEIAESVLRDVIENEGYKVYEDTHKQLAEDLGVDTKPNRYKVQDALKSYANQTMEELDNLINTTLPKSVRRVYQSIIEEAVAAVVAGTKSSDKALRDTLIKWADKGFYGFTDKAGRNWRADTYARTVIKTTSYRVYRDMRERPAEELGIDTYYYSMKSSARAMCSPLQHQIVTKGEAREEEGVRILSLNDYGYGTPGGCLGINCGHYLTPFVVGINNKPDLPDNLKNITPAKAEENARAEAKQRAFEREVRKNKERLKIARELGDKELIQKYKLKGITLDGQYKTLLDENKFLYRNLKRERYVKNPESWAKNKNTLEEEKSKLDNERKRRKLLEEAIKSGKIVSVIGTTVGHTPPPRVGKPNSIMQHNATNGDVLGRTYYDDRGYKSKDIHFTNHKQPDKHPYGIKGEHAHDYVFDDEGKFISKSTRELSDHEREENMDILWRF